MVKPPGSLDIAEEIALLKRRIGETQRINTQGPICITRLGQPVSRGEFAHIKPVVNWNPTAEVDTHDMYHYNEGGDTWWEIPHAGRFRVVIQANWQAFGTFVAGNPPLVNTSLLLNSSGTHNPTNFAIADATAFNAGGAGGMTCAFPMVCEDYLFAAGDKLRPNFYTRYGGTLLVKSYGYTYISITYMGSN